MIYFVQPVDGGPVKIGFSDDVGRRIPELESHYRVRLALLGTMEGDVSVEKEIHRKFSHLRFGLTEQFRPAPDLMAFIGRPLFAAAGDVVEIPVSSNRRGPVLTIKAYPEWREWLDEFRAFCQETGEVAPDNASLVDLMAISYARAKGFRLPPPR